MVSVDRHFLNVFLGVKQSVNYVTVKMFFSARLIVSFDVASNSISTRMSHFLISGNGLCLCVCVP